MVNIGLPVGTGSREFMEEFDKKIIPRLDEYKPDILFISAGFDAHKRDPTGVFLILVRQLNQNRGTSIGREGLLCHDGQDEGGGHQTLWRKDSQRTGRWIPSTQLEKKCKRAHFGFDQEINSRIL